ncbi:MAG TPA: trypsin-like peptidase domain-containing protein [Plantibacter sp.]|uniref:S1C family serine protease n=1 Tax=unclassified Plantibacter TaxID=2624265 RepID=UPI002CE1A359|nr:trypsin-like peptidase domain-containing protein [Plantibacter sp.]
MTDTADGQQPADNSESTPTKETTPQAAPAEDTIASGPSAAPAQPEQPTAEVLGADRTTEVLGAAPLAERHTAGAYFPPPTAMPPATPLPGQHAPHAFGAQQQPGSPYQQPNAQQPGSAFARQQAPGPYAAYQQPQPGQQHSPYGGAPYAGAQPGGAPQQPVQATPRPKKTNRPLAGMIAMLAVGALIGGASGAGATLWVTNATKSSVSSSEAGSKAFTINDDADVSLTTAIAATAGPSVVTLSVQGADSAGTGSGIVLSKDGYVLTNTHVVTLDGQVADATIRVTDANGKLYNAKIVGTDPVYDLAVIKLDDASGLTPMEFADSDKLNVGETAVAIGAPLGLAGTVTDGIVSALNRSITVASSAVPDSGSSDDGGSDSGSDGDSQSPWNFDVPGQTTPTQSTSSISIAVIQTDAAINPGNSGGALVDGTGKLIGVNVAIASAGSTDSSSQSGSIGVGFAIPSNIAKRVSDEIIKTGKATHGLLGATVKDAASDAKSTVAGALIDKVTDNGAAQAAGLKAGDIVTEFNGVPVTGANDLTAQVRALAAGATAKLTFTRGNDSQTADVTLGELAL